MRKLVILTIALLVITMAITGCMSTEEMDTTSQSSGSVEVIDTAGENEVVQNVELIEESDSLDLGEVI